MVKFDLVNNRLIPNAMEPRSAVGEFDRTTGDYTLTTTSQNPHVIRLLMGAFVLHIPENKLRVVAPDQRGYSPGARPTDVAAYATEALAADVRCFNVESTRELDVLSSVAVAASPRFTSAANSNNTAIASGVLKSSSIASRNR